MITEYFKQFFLKQKQKFLDEGNNHEDREVIKFFNSLGDVEVKYLEVGSGLGRFAIKVKKDYKKFNIECLEINPALAKITSEQGLNTVVASATSLPYSNESFDVVHCSHVIEHFKYPEITQVLDELVRVTKKGGYIIIRSPLMHPDFYLDIDHVRPYPPETILTYFNNEQQQKVGNAQLKQILCWYRRQNLKIFNIGSSQIKYSINSILAVLWTHLRFPFSKKNGYILILQKIV